MEGGREEYSRGVAAAGDGGVVQTSPEVCVSLAAGRRAREENEDGAGQGRTAWVWELHIGSERAGGLPARRRLAGRAGVLCWCCAGALGWGCLCTLQPSSAG